VSASDQLSVSKLRDDKGDRGPSDAQSRRQVLLDEWDVPPADPIAQGEKRSSGALFDRMQSAARGGSGQLVHERKRVLSNYASECTLACQLAVKAFHAHGQCGEVCDADDGRPRPGPSAKYRVDADQAFPADHRDFDPPIAIAVQHERTHTLSREVDRAKRLAAL
jgi:hypothetical protein